MQTDQRYPIGRFDRHAVADQAHRRTLIESIRKLPYELRQRVAELSGVQLQKTYREGGWTIRQLIHHLADSHLNGYTRFKLTLTEDSPVIKPYDQDLWAETMDNRQTPIDISVELLVNLHERWADLLSAMTDRDYSRTFIHPESGRWELHEVLGLYEWHGRHHLAHIASAIDR